MEKKKIKIPIFKNEDAERDFWAKNEAFDYFDETKPIKLDLSYLKPSTQTITLRLTKSLLEDAKILANRRDIPYQSMLKMFLAERIAEEYRA